MHETWHLKVLIIRIPKQNPNSEKNNYIVILDRDGKLINALLTILINACWIRATFYPAILIPLFTKQIRLKRIEIRTKTIELSKSTTIIYHWLKGHAGVQGNERTD